jgi:hypothetical protein
VFELFEKTNLAEFYHSDTLFWGVLSKLHRLFWESGGGLNSRARKWNLSRLDRPSFFLDSKKTRVNSGVFKKSNVKFLTGAAAEFHSHF